MYIFSLKSARDTETRNSKTFALIQIFTLTPMVPKSICSLFKFAFPSFPLFSSIFSQFPEGNFPDSLSFNFSSVCLLGCLLACLYVSVYFQQGDWNLIWFNVYILLPPSFHIWARELFYCVRWKLIWYFAHLLNIIMSRVQNFFSFHFYSSRSTHNNQQLSALHVKFT